jgi:hypothetical protein
MSDNHHDDEDFDDPPKRKVAAGPPLQTPEFRYVAIQPWTFLLSGTKYQNFQQGSRAGSI